MTERARALDPRPLIVLLLLPIVVFGESAAYYGHRSAVVTWWTTRAGVSMEEAFASLSWGAPAMVVGCVLAGGIGALIGGWGTLVLGLLVLAVGMGLVPMVGSEALVVPGLIAGIGRGMLGVAMVMVIADAFRGTRSWLLAGGFALFYAAVNLGALTGPYVGGEVVNLYGLEVVFVGAAIIVTISAALAAAAGLAWLLLGRQFPESDPRRRRVHAGPHLASIGLLLLGLPLIQFLYAATETSGQLGYTWIDLHAAGATLSSVGLLQSLNPVVAVLVASVVAVVTIALHLLEVTSRVLIIAGIGSIIAAFGAGITQFAGWPLDVGSALPIFTGVVVLGVAEVLIEVFLVAGWARDLHWRLLAPIAGLWRGGIIALSALMSSVTTSGWTDDSGGPAGASWWLPPALLVLGVLLGAAGLALAPLWRLDTEPTADTSPDVHREAPEV